MTGVHAREVKCPRPGGQVSTPGRSSVHARGSSVHGRGSCRASRGSCVHTRGQVSTPGTSSVHSREIKCPPRESSVHSRRGQVSTPGGSSVLQRLKEVKCINIFIYIYIYHSFMLCLPNLNCAVSLSILCLGCGLACNLFSRAPD
jgi:hypothetical protein